MTDLALLGVVLTIGLLGFGWWLKDRLRLKPLFTQANSDEPPTAIVVGPPDAPLVRISRALARPEYVTEQITIGEELTREVESLLFQLPRFGLNALLSPDKYVVAFSKEVMRGLKDGSLTMMNSTKGGHFAIAVTSDSHRIVETGKLAHPSMKPALGLFWQVAAIVTAQKFLAEINAQLGQISEAVEYIKRYLESERIGTVQASFDRLGEIIEAMNSSRWDRDDAHRWVTVLDELDLECSRIVKAGCTQKDDLIQRTATLDIGRYRVNDGAVARTIQASDEFGAHFGLCAAALYVRVAATHVRAALPVGRADLAARVASCVHDSQTLEAVNEDRHKAVAACLQEAIPNGKAIFSREAAKSDALKAVSAAATSTRDRIAERLTAANQIIESTKRDGFLADGSTETGLLLEIGVAQDGSLQTVHRIAGGGPIG